MIIEVRMRSDKKKRMDKKKWIKKIFWVLSGSCDPQYVFVVRMWPDKNRIDVKCFLCDGDNAPRQKRDLKNS